MPKISFIIPIYNKEKYLDKCLSSVKVQTDHDFECLLVDDGSTDDSAKICEKYTTDSRFLYVHQENAGVSAARNIGLDRAVGNYIHFLDADDYIDENFVALLHPVASDKNADILFFNYKRINFDGTMLEQHIFDEKMINNTSSTLLENFVVDLLSLRHIGFGFNKIFRQEFARKLSFNEDLAFNEDRNFLYKAFPTAKRIVYTSLNPYYYVENADAATANFFSNDGGKVELAKNPFYIYMFAVLDTFDFYHKNNLYVLDILKPMMLIIGLKIALMRAKQFNLNIKNAIIAAFATIDCLAEFELGRLHESISTYADICGLSWKDRINYLTFALAVADTVRGRNSLADWQEMNALLYPHGD